MLLKIKKDACLFMFLKKKIKHFSRHGKKSLAPFIKEEFLFTFLYKLFIHKKIRQNCT